MKKIIVSLLIFILIPGLFKVEASSDLAVISSYTRLDEQEEYSPGLYLVVTKCQDSLDFEKFVGEISLLGFCSEQYLTATNLDDILAADFDVACYNEEVRKLITIADEYENGKYFSRSILFILDSTYTYDEVFYYVPLDNYGVYKLNFSLNPTIAVANDTHILNYDEHFTLEDIKKCYTATDNYDHDLTDQIKFETNFPQTEAEYKIGEYYITATVEDSSGNVASVTNKIYLVDITSPKFNVEVLSKEYEYGTTISLADILADVSCFDNYDGEITYDKWKLSKPVDNSILTEQEIIISAFDSSGNQSSFTLNITFSDNEAPVISVSTIDISTTNPLTANEIINLLVKSGQIEGDYSSYELKTDYFEYQNKAGIFDANLVMHYENGSRNYRFKINVVDKKSPNEEKAYLPFVVAGAAAVLIIGISVYLIYRQRKLN